MTAVRLARPDEVEALLTLWREAMSPPSATDSVEGVRVLIGRPDTWVLVEIGRAHV